MLSNEKPIYPKPVVTELDWDDERCSSDKLFWVYVSDEKLAEFVDSEKFQAVAESAADQFGSACYLGEFALYHVAESIFSKAFVESGLAWETSYADFPALWGTVSQECCDWKPYKGNLVKGRADFKEDAAVLREFLEKKMQEEINLIAARPPKFKNRYARLASQRST